MSNRSLVLPVLVLAIGLAASGAVADDVIVMISGGFMSTYRALMPGFERTSGDHVITVSGPSMGTTEQAIPVRLARGEADDVVVMVGYALDRLVETGKVVADSKVDVARSPIGMAVKAGAPVPDISTVDKLRDVLLHAGSVAYSDSASGVYIRDQLFKRLGIEADMKGKSCMIPATPVAEIVARGEAEIGFQQVAELLPVPGITFVGRIPDEVQNVTIYSAGLSATAQHPEAGRGLIRYIASPDAAPVLERMGLMSPAAR